MQNESRRNHATRTPALGPDRLKLVAEAQAAAPHAEAPEAQVQIPLAVRLTLARAAIQVLADEAGADVLHIKGSAVDPSLRDVLQHGTDVDILARPEHVAALDRVLRAHGWRVYSSFTYGSPFEHAQTYWHESWGYLDLHRSFPGIRADPAGAFATLARDGGTIDVAGIPCPVPGVDAQIVVLILNAARAGGVAGTPLARRWDEAGSERRARLEALVAELDAPTAFGAAFDRLDEHRAERDHDLWRVITRGGTRTEEWRARLRAAPTRRQALRIALRAPLVNTEKLAHDLGRSPTVRDVLRALAARALRAGRDLVRGRVRS